MYMVHRNANTGSTTSGVDQHQKLKWFLLVHDHEFARGKTVASMLHQVHLARTPMGTVLAIRFNGYAMEQCRPALRRHQATRATPSKFRC